MLKGDPKESRNILLAQKLPNLNPHIIIGNRCPSRVYDFPWQLDLQAPRNVVRRPEYALAREVLHIKLIRVPV